MALRRLAPGMKDLRYQPPVWGQNEYSKGKNAVTRFEKTVQKHVVADTIGGPTRSHRSHSQSHKQSVATDLWQKYGNPSGIDLKNPDLISQVGVVVSGD